MFDKLGYNELTISFLLDSYINAQVSLMHAEVAKYLDQNKLTELQTKMNQILESEPKNQKEAVMAQERLLTFIVELVKDYPEVNDKIIETIGKLDEELMQEFIAKLDEASVRVVWEAMNEEAEIINDSLQQYHKLLIQNKSTTSPN